MRVIPFKINNIAARMYVAVREQLVPTLKEQGLLKDDDLLEVDWNNNGLYVVTWVKQQHIICPYCGTANSINPDDLGLEEFECGRCDNMFAIPETVEELKEMDSYTPPQPTHYRIMCRGEDGYEFCLKNGVPAEYADLVCAGYQAGYTEGQTCWTEAE